MIIQIKGADFSNCGIGTMPLIISDDAKAIVNHYSISDTNRKEKAYLAVLYMMDSLGYDDANGYWNSLTMLLMPCLATTVEEAFYDIKNDFQMSDPTNQKDITNVYNLTDDNGIQFSYSKAYSKYREWGGENDVVPAGYMVDNLTSNFINTNARFSYSGFISYKATEIVGNTYVMGIPGGAIGGIRPYYQEWNTADLYIGYDGERTINKNVFESVTTNNIGAAFSIYDIVNGKYHSYRHLNTNGMIADVTFYDSQKIESSHYCYYNRSCNVFPSVAWHTIQGYHSPVYLMGLFNREYSEEDLIKFSNIARQTAKMMK